MSSCSDEDEVEDLSLEAEVSYREALSTTRTTTKTKKPIVTVSMPKSPATVAAAATKPAKRQEQQQALLPPYQLVKRAFATSHAQGWKTALQQALKQVEEEENAEELFSSSLLDSLTTTLSSPAITTLLNSQAQVDRDFALLKELQEAYVQELKEWDDVKSKLVQHPPPTLTHENEKEFPHEFEDEALLASLQEQAKLPQTCLETLRATEQRCKRVLKQIETCNEESKQLARAFSKATFDEDTRQPKKLVKLLSGGDEAFEF